MRSATRLFVFLVCVCCAASLPTLTAQTPPQQVKLQGYLADQSGGTPVPANGSHSMTFELWDAPSAGLMLHSSGVLSVYVSDGMYEATLPFGPEDFTDAPRYLQIIVDAETLTPRLEIATSPFAFVAAEARSVADGAVTAHALAADAVTPDKLASICAEGQVLQQGAAGWLCADLPASGAVCSSGDFLNCYDVDPVTLGTGVCRAGQRYCNAMGTGFGACTGAVLPSVEVCDNLDNDCDGTVDDDAVDMGSWYTDTDGDGYGDDATLVMACTQPPGKVGLGGDCDDTTDTTFPGALEFCDGVDNDCSGTADDDCVDYYCTEPEQACLLGCADLCEGNSTCGSQCVGECNLSQQCYNKFVALTACGIQAGCDDPMVPLIDLCLRTNCSGQYIEVFGSECTGAEIQACGSDIGACVPGTQTCSNDLWGECLGDVEPAPEVCGDSIDNDCDGSTDEEGNVYWIDVDLDGYGLDDLGQAISTCGMPPPGYVPNNLDCDDGNDQVHPGATEICDDQIDNDCDPATEDELLAWYRDFDGDTWGDINDEVHDCRQPAGYVVRDSDCDDTDPAVNPDAAEICDGVDNNCDGVVDETCVDFCALAFPSWVNVQPTESFDVFVWVFAAGITDQTSGNDPHPSLVCEVGWGPDASDPASSPGWTWLAAAPSPGWFDPSLDEYFAAVAIDTIGAGTFDYAGRASSDGGATWTYCDLDGSTNGYAPDQAGDASVVP